MITVTHAARLLLLLLLHVSSVVVWDPELCIRRGHVAVSNKQLSLAVFHGRKLLLARHWSAHLQSLKCCGKLVVGAREEDGVLEAEGALLGDEATVGTLMKERRGLGLLLVLRESLSIDLLSFLSGGRVVAVRLFRLHSALEQVTLDGSAVPQLRRRQPLRVDGRRVARDLEATEFLINILLRHVLVVVFRDVKVTEHVASD